MVQDSNLFINLWFLAGFRDINQSETQQNSSSLTNKYVPYHDTAQLLPYINEERTLVVNTIQIF